MLPLLLGHCQLLHVQLLRIYSKICSQKNFLRAEELQFFKARVSAALVRSSLAETIYLYPSFVVVMTMQSTYIFVNIVAGIDT